MSTTKHTPGPWHFAEPFRILKASKDRGELYLRGIGNGSTHVGYASICPIHSNGEALANARLIAASPELLEACKALLDLTLPSRCNVRPHEDCGCYSCQQYNAIEFIQAAIDKATKGEAE